MRRRSFAKVLRDNRGSIAVHLGLLIFFLIGFTALGTELVSVILVHRRMQSAADAAAMNGAMAIATGYPASPVSESKATTASMGFVDGQNATTITATVGPTSGPHIGDTKYIEVIVDRIQPLGLISVFGIPSYDLRVRAVATTVTEGVACVLGLDTGLSQTVLVNNNGVLANPNCGVVVNSNAPDALTVENGASITGPVSVTGGWLLANNGTLNNPHNISGAAPVADPYAGVSIGTVPACTVQSGTVNNNQTVGLTPGHFCAGFNLKNRATANLSAGTYYIDSQLIMGTNAILNAPSGSTLVINGNYAVQFGSGAQLTIVAPTTGNFAGLAMYSSRTATSSIVQDFKNNMTVTITGALYFPNQILDLAPGTLVGATVCTQIVARVVRVYNNAYLNNNCAGIGASIGYVIPQLTE